MNEEAGHGIAVSLLFVGALVGVVLFAKSQLLVVGNSGFPASADDTLRGAVRMFMIDCRAPGPDDTLVGLLWTGPGDVVATWQGPYVESRDDLLDEWGNAYILRVPGQVAVDFDLISYGSDGIPGGTGEAADRFF